MSPDDGGYTEFYNAIRSGNIKHLDKLVNKWKKNDRLDELDEILSKAYEDLQLKMVPLSDESQVFVENQLINIRFFSASTGEDPDVFNIDERIELILEMIHGLKTEEKVDEKFLFISKCIARNIHVLKRRLKSTYNELPWEEIEFCLISFVSSHIKRQEMNLFCQATLNKNKLMDHLENFANRLEHVKDVIKGVDPDKLVVLPGLNREQVVLNIIDKYPELEGLYKDHQQLRDMYSLKKISDCIELSSTADPKEREGQLIITRVLQAIGEYLKNTLESPKLSNTTGELLLLSLPRNTRKVIIDLRNSLSHAYSLSKRTEIEDNGDFGFYVGVRNDINKVGAVIIDILFDNKIKMIRILLRKILDSDNWNEIKEIFGTLSSVELFDLETLSGNLKTMEHEKLEKLIKELSESINDKTGYEKEMFSKIDKVIDSTGSRSKDFQTDYVMGFALFITLCKKMGDYKDDPNVIRGIKFNANKTLENILPKIQSYSLKEIAGLTTKIFNSARPRIPQDNLGEVERLICEIFYMAEFGTNDIKWIEELRGKLKGSFISTRKQNPSNATKRNQLPVKLSELSSILSGQGLKDRPIEKFSLYKKDKKIQSVVEILILDIMSILGGKKKVLENNNNFLDGHTPLLIGKVLRNHLAHDNALVDILASDPSVAIVLNAKKLCEVGGDEKIGRTIVDDPSRLKDKYDQDLATVINQQQMFVALEEGNLENLKECLRKGSDINGRSVDSSTALHAAAKGSLEVIKFVLNQKLDVNHVNVKKESPLHIAAAYGRRDIVEFFLKEKLVSVDTPDWFGSTPLHYAAENGHKDTVEVLLRYNASTVAKNISGVSPVNNAIRNSHTDISKLLIKKEVDVDVNETKGGYTALHEAAEFGHLHLVNFLLENKANVNAKTDQNWTPLHAASFNGHYETVKVLLRNGSDVNIRILNGCTTLHYAVENGHEQIAEILLKHGVMVNAFDKTYHNTPLHYAAKDGYKKIVELLLENKASVNAATVEGVTPLHFAVKSRHLDITTVLLRYPVDIHARDRMNATPLHYAVDVGDKEITEVLIKNKADVNSKDYKNATPLHVGALKGYKDIVEILIKNKSDVNALDIKGSTPLHFAATNGANDVINLLIKNRADVNSRSYNGITPLNEAAMNGHQDAIVFLMKNQADVNLTGRFGITPLHSAIAAGHKNIVDLLIKNNAQVNPLSGFTPLDIAVEFGHKEIIQMLITNGINAKNTSGLISAIKNNRKEIVEVLIENGADVNSNDGEPLSLAVLTGYTDIVEILLKNQADANMKGPEDVTPLHLAAKRGDKNTVKFLIRNGGRVDATSNREVTPLHLASQEGHEEVVKILVSEGANINAQNIEGVTPLHIAATAGNDMVVKVLLDNQANICIKDHKNRIPLQMAIAHGRLETVKMLLKPNKMGLNTKGTDDWTMLHIASQNKSLDIVKYLVEQGCDVNARNSAGSKPVHIAAREGHKDIVEFFIKNGSSINEPGAADQTLLHYAALKGQVEVVKFLIDHGGDVNAKDLNGSTPVHITAASGCKAVIELLLKNGAVYNPVDNFRRKPLDVATDRNVISLLTATQKLFEAVKSHDSDGVVNVIKSGGFVNAKNSDGATPLHFAAWKGYHDIVDVLLKNHADPNVIGNKGFTPLHYAAKFSHLKVIVGLLSNGAVYETRSNTGKTPQDLSEDPKIISLFGLLGRSFKNVERNNTRVVRDISGVDTDTLRAVMCGRDRNNRTLIVTAIKNKFSEVKRLKEMSQGDISNQLNTALVLCHQGDYETSLNLFKSAFETRKNILGPDNPGTLDIQINISMVLYKQGAYQEALKLVEDVYHKQVDALGLNDQNTLSTRNMIALIFYRQGKDEEASEIYQQVYPKQNELLGPNHPDVLNTQLHMALVFVRQGKYEEALSINKTIFEKRKKILGVNNIDTVSAQNNIALVLSHQGKSEEALKIYRDVFEKKKLILGINHIDTLRTLHNIAGILQDQKKNKEALEAFQEVLNIQKNVLGPNHPETLTTQHNLGRLFLTQGKFNNALKVYSECLEQTKAIFGPNHPQVQNILKGMEIINMRYKFEGSDIPEVLHYLQRDINIAANNGDIQTVERLLNDGADVNDRDVAGRTPLHYAVSNGHTHIVNTLIKHGGDVTQVTNKGNTPLHTATSKNYKGIVEILLQNVARDKSNMFINAKTVSGGTTSLHVAARNGFVGIVISLLKHGAVYDIKNMDGKTPVDLSEDRNVRDLLTLVAEMFEDTKNGKTDVIQKLKAMKPEECVAVTNARNDQGNTLLQVAIANKRKDITRKLLEILKKMEL